MARSDYSSMGMAEEGYNSAGSQFFIMTKDNANLNGQYAAFGKVIEGYDIVEKIANVKVKEADSEGGEASTPESAPVITNLTVETYGANYGMPNTINYDDIQKKVQQYQQYYQQLMNSYSGNSTTSAEGTSETTTEGK